MVSMWMTYLGCEAYQELVHMLALIKRVVLHSDIEGNVAYFP